MKIVSIRGAAGYDAVEPEPLGSGNDWPSQRSYIIQEPSAVGRATAATPSPPSHLPLSALVFFSKPSHLISVFFCAVSSRTTEGKDDDQ